jgi:hypothetical protein
VHGAPGERADAVRELDDSLHVCQRSHCVRCDRECDDPRTVGQLPLEIVVVERRRRGSRRVDRGTDVACELEPGRHVAVVVEPGDENLVTFAQRSSDRPRQHEVQRRHVRAEQRFSRLAAQERRGGETRLLEQRVAAATVAEGAAEVRVRLAEVRRDRLDDRIRHLRAARRVEECRRPAECGEPAADGVDVESHDAHRKGH